MKFNKFITLIITMAMVSCTSMRSYEPQQANLARKLNTGDRLVIYRKSGSILKMTLTRIDEDILVGSLTVNRNSPVQININDIEEIRTERTDVVKSTLAVAVGAILVLPIFLFAALLVGPIR